MKMSEGLREGGVVVGNNYDKYGSGNPVVRWIMRGFEQALTGLVVRVMPQSIHEVGCGEGYWVIEWARQGIEARGSDFSSQVIALAQSNASDKGLDPSRFAQGSIYDLDPSRDGADLIVCCEVLEHLENPRAGLEALKSVASDYVILSVPREPLWCVLNLLRGKYLSAFGNTPGHIQHWSSGAFVRLVEEYFDIIEVRQPLPWTMLLCKVRREE